MNMKKKEPKYKVGETVIYHYFDEPHTFTIKRIESDEEDDVTPLYKYYDCEKGESGCLLYEEDIDGIDTITRENLEDNGWKFSEWMNDKFKDVGNLEMWEKRFVVNGKEFYCTISTGSNTTGRDFSIHIDNCDRETVGCMDINSYSQIVRFLELLSE